MDGWMRAWHCQVSDFGFCVVLRVVLRFFLRFAQTCQHDVDAAFACVGRVGNSATPAQVSNSIMMMVWRDRRSARGSQGCQGDPRCLLAPLQLLLPMQPRPTRVCTMRPCTCHLMHAHVTLIIEVVGLVQVRPTSGCYDCYYFSTIPLAGPRTDSALGLAR